MKILAIETSCDDTSVAILDGLKILSNIVSSQTAIHQKWGGVIPELAAREHVQNWLPVLEEALVVANVKLSDIQAIAVTNRPGLVGSLSVGVTAAKSLAYTLKIPFIAVHHMEGHLLSVLSESDLPEFPMMSLLVSGGHTELVLVRKIGEYQIIGQTRDDAAGEAFDKGARLLGLPYPGGLSIQQKATRGNANRYVLPRGLEHDPNYDFSFSGLKTAMSRLVEKEGGSLNIEDAAASLQSAIIEVLVKKTVQAALAHGCQTVSIGGGVAANLMLRGRLTEETEKHALKLRIPELSLCTDNAAMIGIAAYFRLIAGQTDSWMSDALANSDLPGSM